MKLSAPKQNIWFVAVIVGVLGVLGTFTAIPFVSVNAFWFVTAGFVILTLATMLKGI